ncbi:MAG: DNA double-strand break repair nuclease NurA [SAR202 cluster bacterium]|nr:DNA double-strand break repair nuclease NurA [SAR202 cluster bacterium]
MALDIHKAAAQMGGLAQRLRSRGARRDTALGNALVALAEADPVRVEQRRRDGKATFLIAGVDDAIAGATPAPRLPPEHVVHAVDGSHIDVDRHSPARCYLINIGEVTLRYGELASARLANRPALFVDDDDLVVRNPNNATQETPIEGPLLGILRACMEVEALAALVECAPDGPPVLALLDGSLILWGLVGQAFPDYVKDELLEGRLLPALDRLRDQAARRTLAVASYVSYPRGADAVNALRLHACPFPKVNCDEHCGATRPGERPCDTVHGVDDATLFDAALAVGDRSAVFRSTSSVMERYGEHAVSLWYVNVGEEVARVEMPAWCAGGAALDFAHAAIVAQAAKGRGYPVALQESHEQAVVNGADRQAFERMVHMALTAERLSTETSLKSRSKRTRFV